MTKIAQTYLLGLACALAVAPLNAQVVTGETMLNPFFTGSDYSNWTINADWRPDGAQDRLVFDLKPTNQNPVGFSTSIGTGKTGAAIASENGLNANASYLTGFDFSLAQPFYNQIGPFGSVDGEYDIFFEVDVLTAGGTFRAASNANDVYSSPNGPFSLTFTWQGGSFLGDPAAQNGGNGVLLADITGITYTVAMQTITANSLTGNDFPTIDNMSLTYVVSTVPEPAAAGLLLTGMLLMGLRRRKTASLMS